MLNSYSYMSNMGERARHYELAFAFVEVIHISLEADYGQGRCDLDAMFVRLKDLLAYSLEHAEIMEQREGVELLGLGMFFGMSSHPTLRHNQRRIGLVSEEALAYQGRAERVEEEVARRNTGKSGRREDSREGPQQPRLL